MRYKHADQQSWCSAAVRNLTKSASPPHRHPPGCHLPAPAWHQTGYLPHLSDPYYVLPVHPRRPPAHSRHPAVPGYRPEYHFSFLPHLPAFPENRYLSPCCDPVRRTVAVPSVPDPSLLRSADRCRCNPPSGNSVRPLSVLRNPLP